MLSAIRAADFCLAGAVLTYQVMPKLQVGAELFHRTADSQGTPAASSIGVGWRYDVSKNFHLFLVRFYSVYFLAQALLDGSETANAKSFARIMIKQKACCTPLNLE